MNVAQLSSPYMLYYISFVFCVIFIFYSHLLLLSSNADWIVLLLQGGVSYESCFYHDVTQSKVKYLHFASVASFDRFDGQCISKVINFENIYVYIFLL